MILAHGRIYENQEQERMISSLQEEVTRTLLTAELSVEEVITACDRLAARALAGVYDPIAKPLLEMMQTPYETYLDYCRMFSADNLRRKVEWELGSYPAKQQQISEHLYRERQPLGVLLHIAAGNMDALPAYSVIEGLLAGNINILKLPTGDSGVSVALLSELIRECPALTDYIYVFDVPSTDMEAIRRLAEVADGVVVWGGDTAVSAAHQFIQPNTKLVAWGHKLSFAYAKPDCPEEMLEALAYDICKTNQTLCSSCQGIYVDTEDMEQVQAFGRRFFDILKRKNTEVGAAPRGMRAKNTLKLYNDRLEGIPNILSEDGVSVVVKEGRELEISYLFRNVWIKALPRAQIISTLKHQKGYLQSCALLLEQGEDREEVISYLIRAGVTRITDGNLSKMQLGEAHDGMLPLKEYSRVIDIWK